MKIMLELFLLFAGALCIGVILLVMVNLIVWRWSRWRKR